MNFRRRRPREDNQTTYGAKWARRGPPSEDHVPPGFHGGKRRRRPRPYAIHFRWFRSATLGEDRTWRTWARYTTEVGRDEALGRLRHKGSWHRFVDFRAV